jgi:quercetin dioxygenase-like cupin family protein
MQRTGLLVLVLLGISVSHAAGQVKFNATPILQSGTTVAGAPISYPKTDSAEVTGLRVDIGPGGETGRHRHPYPTFVYVLEGTVEVEMEGGMVHSYKAGDSFLEALNTWHNGRNTGPETTKILVVFVGVKGKPNLERPQ